LRAQTRGELVRVEVPRILETWLPGEGPTGAGDVLTDHVHSLQASGWFVEEWQGNANYDLVDSRYSEKRLLVDVPTERMNEDEWYWEFSTSAMVQHWVKWSTLLWECFLGSKERFDSFAVGRYARLISSPGARVFDLIRIRTRRPDMPLVQDPVEGAGVRRLWGYIAPLKPGTFPRSSIFGPVRFVEAKEVKQFSLGQYTVMEAYDQRFFAAGSFLHSEYGKEHGRDTYILALVSRSEVVILQTLLPAKASRGDVTADLRAILTGRASQ
jgi:hypothetical protein